MGLYRSDWVKGGSTGAVTQNGKQESYIAVTAAASREFKTIAGAERFMERKGYKKA